MSESNSLPTLAEVLSLVREQIRDASTRAEDPKFKVVGIEIEIQVATILGSEKQGGLALGVLSIGAETSNQTQNSHTIRLRLSPSDLVEVDSRSNEKQN